MKKTILFILVTGLLYQLNAQVKGPERIIGTYTGDQKKDLAHGVGKSVGKDTYEGAFKKGLPHGEGEYIFSEDIEIDGEIYSAGDKYVGQFNKGIFEGKGKLIYSDSEKEALEGYWFKGKYSGKTKAGYEVLVKKNIVRVVCIYNGSAKNDISIKGLKDDVVEAGPKSIEFVGIEWEDGKPVSKYKDIPASRYPYTVHIKGTIPSTGVKAEFKILIERPGTWSITLESN